jgi:pyrroline-5-carboxylate reductase
MAFTMKDKSIAIIGGGNLGLSIANGLLKAGFAEGEKICVTRRRLHLIKKLGEKGVYLTSDNKEAVRRSDIIILAVKPHQINHILEEIKPELQKEKHLVISVVTGIKLEQIESRIGDVPAFRAMPNTAIALQESMTCISGNGYSEEFQDVVRSIFDQMGETVVINEELMEAATVVGACGIAFALRFMRAMSQGGIEIGFGSELSQLITAQTVKGAAKLILDSGNHPEEEIDKVTTPMGITISGLNEMEHQGFSSSVIKGLLTSYNKIGKMRK